MNKTITSTMLNRSYQKIEHPTGLDILLCPMEGFTTAYALFAAKVGSIDVTFKTEREDDFVTVPAGIAHFLEHKMFESLDGDTFEKYAKTGASANAYTAFDKTAYLFSCTDNFNESFEILLDQVTSAYFTPENVEKEQGIIGQEIKMYEDAPSWRILFNLLGALYHNNPIKIDIAGTVESIAEIDAPLLYRCYNTFYNLNNMVLVVCGNFNADEAMEIVDRMIKPAEKITVSTKPVDEPRGVVEKEVNLSFPVAVPMFHIGFKGVSSSADNNVKKQLIGSIITDMICGESSDLYRKLYDTGLINLSFDCEMFTGRDHACAIFEGESRDPHKVYEILCDTISRYRAEGLNEEDFIRCKKAAYGSFIGSYCKPTSMASALLEHHFAGYDNSFDVLEMLSELTFEDATACFLEDFCPEHSSISIINPI